MKKASRLFAAFAWCAVSMVLSSEASATGASITFSGALVNPSCQLHVTLPPGASTERHGAVNISHCGNAPASFSTTVNVSSHSASIDSGIGQITVRESAAGPVLEVSYN